jgi:FtsZ-binding cell division protein ZapB
MLSGEWGIGKTYFWNAFKEDFLAEKKVIYISLFGKNSLEEIQAEVILQILEWKNGDTLNIPLPFSSMLSLLDKKEFKNILICFDDFERLSDKITLKDVMGLISQFKEQKESKVIIILNENELDGLSDIFALYKEKIVDYSLHYQPNQEEIFEALKEDLETITFCEPLVIYNFFKKIKLKNIRIMKQSLYYLGYFSFIGAKEYHAEVINHFVEIALNLFVFKAKSNLDYSHFEAFKEYQENIRIKEMFPENEIRIKENNTYNKYLNAYILLNYFSTNSQLEKHIYSFIDTQHILKSEIEILLDKNNMNRDKENVREALAQIVERIQYDLKASLREDTAILYGILAENTSLIPHIIDSQKLNQYFEYIKKHNPYLMTNAFIKAYLSSYMTANKEEKELDFFLALLQKKQKKWNEEELEDLHSLDVDNYQYYMKKSLVFFYESFTFFERKQYNPDFSYAIFKIKEALSRLREEDDNMKWKIDRILIEKSLSLADDTIAFDSEGM